MNMQMCNNGHFYDADVSAECPSCKKSHAEEGSFPKTGIVTEFPSTGSYMAQREEKEDSSFPKTAQVRSASGAFPKTAPVGSAVGTFPKTRPISSLGQTPSGTGWNPVLGWLVCIRGGKCGRDFKLTQEVNYIGRAVSNDVCLEFDETISRDTTLTITYLKQSRVFRLNVEQSRNPVTVNGSPVLTELYLRDKDEISIGNTGLKLVCFCDASFAWEN